MNCKRTVTLTLFVINSMQLKYVHTHFVNIYIVNIDFALNSDLKFVDFGSVWVDSVTSLHV